MATSTDLTLRPANPSYAEGVIYARYLDEVSDGFFRLRLGGEMIDIVARAFTRPRHEVSFENVTFVEREGHILGMISGFTAEQQRTFSRRPLLEAAGHQGAAARLRLQLVDLLCRPMLRILEHIPDGDFYFQTMLVEKEARGMGVGSMLLEHLEERAREAGSTQLSLHVAANNVRARELYERRGWVVESPWPDLLLVPPLFHRMTRSPRAPR